MTFLSQHSEAVQAFSALAIAFLTFVLILVTSRYVKATQTMLDVMERDSAIRLQPRMIPTISYEWHGGAAKGHFRLTNPGPNDAIIRKVELGYYCRRSECCQARPVEYPLLNYRLIPDGHTVEQCFEVSPLGRDTYHEAHEGECEWIFTVSVACTDLLGLLRHAYRYDEALGIHHFVYPPRLKEKWLRKKFLAARIALGTYFYKFRKQTLPVK